MKLIATCVVLSALVISAFGYKILGVFPTMAKSHYIVGSALMKGLAEKGHDVTILAPFTQKKPLKNLREVTNPAIIEATKGLMDNIIDMRDQSAFESLTRIFQIGIDFTNITLRDPKVIEFLSRKEKYDVVVFEVFFSEALLGIANHFDAPVVGVSTFGASLITCRMVGSPTPLSYVPNPFLSFSDRMTFVERLLNFVATSLQTFYNDVFYMPEQSKLYNAAFPDPKPSLEDLVKNVSLVLLNTHFSLGYPRPYVPNMIEVGGMHLNRQTKPLPDDIKKFLDSATEGVIYFSMGSNLKSSTLPIEKRNEILKAFASLKQKVLWKWEEPNLPGKSDNILIKDWFPQDDILAHPNVKAFITHGGLLSTTEAIYHGVPIIGIPMFGDQFLNMERAIKNGFGLLVDYHQLTAATLAGAIKEMTSNNKYSENIKRLSAVYRDQPINPLDQAIYWVEYVARHKGAPHLHSAGMDLNFIQYHSLDVLATIFGSVFFVFYLFYFFVKKLLSLCSSSDKSAKKKVDKRKKHN